MAASDAANNQNQQLDQVAANSDEVNEIRGKAVVARKVTGLVKWFNVKHGYGFITRDDNKNDIFVHQTAIIKNNPQKYLRSVDDGEEVEFDVVRGDKGFEAVNVTGPNGTEVRGSKYAAERRPNARPGGYQDGRDDGHFRYRPRGGRRNGRPPFGHRGGPFYHRGGPFPEGGGNMRPNFVPPYGNFGPPQMAMRPPFDGPPRGFNRPYNRGRARPPFPNDFGHHSNFQGRGRFFRGRGGPMIGGPMEPLPPPPGDPSMGFPYHSRPRTFGRSFHRGRYSRGPRNESHGDGYNYDNDNGSQRNEQGAAQSGA